MNNMEFVDLNKGNTLVKLSFLKDIEEVNV